MAHPVSHKLLPSEPQKLSGALPQALGSWMRALFRGREDGSLKESLSDIIRAHEADENAELSSEERDILRNILSVGDVTVGDVMVPRTEIVALERSSSLEETKRIFLEQRHTRVPVYAESLDHIEGFIHLKDMLPAIAGAEPFALENALRKITFVAPTMSVVDLLVQMRRSGEHIAIVVDEFGGTDGLVTLEDLFEEIVGDIQDEHDEATEHLEPVQLDERTYEADGRVYIDHMEAVSGRAVARREEAETPDTLGGLVISALGHMPTPGESVDIEGLGRIEVLDADMRRVRKLRLTLTEDA